MGQLSADFYLIVKQGSRPGAVYPLQGSSITIGRMAGNQIVIQDDTISRQHARLIWSGTEYVLQDLGSANGSFVNNQQITQPTVLRVGDILRLGSQLSLELSDQTESIDQTFVESGLPAAGVGVAVPPPQSAGMPKKSAASGSRMFLFGFGGFALIGLIVLVVAGLVAVIIFAGHRAGPVSGPTSPPQDTPVPGPTEVASSTPYPTYTPLPTLTLVPTITLPPTLAPIFTATQTVVVVESPQATQAPVPTETALPTLTPTRELLIVATVPLAIGKIVFVSTRDGNEKIYVMDEDGGNVHRLRTSPARDNYPAWSPDGQHIAFVSELDGNADIYVMNADGDNVQRLTHDPAVDYHPSWSPDGQSIIFDSDRDNIMSDIWIMAADGSGQTKLYENGRTPALSPDGRTIVASFRFGSQTNVGLAAADGGGQPQSLVSVGLNLFPDWAPDGGRIAFENIEGADTTQLMLINQDGTGLSNLTPESGTVNLNPSWSSDGSRIAFVSDRDGNYDIYAMNADGSGVQRLTDTAAWEGMPDWSP